MRSKVTRSAEAGLKAQKPRRAKAPGRQRQIGPEPVDIHVAMRVRQRRTELGMGSSLLPAPRNRHPAPRIPCVTSHFWSPLRTAQTSRARSQTSALEEAFRSSSISAASSRASSSEGRSTSWEAAIELRASRRPLTGHAGNHPRGFPTNRANLYQPRAPRSGARG